MLGDGYNDIQSDISPEPGRKPTTFPRSTWVRAFSLYFLGFTGGETVQEVGMVQNGHNSGNFLAPAQLVPMALSFLFFPEEPEGGGIWISTL